MPRASTAAASSPDRGYQLRLDEGVAPMSNSTPTRPEYGNRRATDRTSSGYRYWKKKIGIDFVWQNKNRAYKNVFLIRGCEINSLNYCVNWKDFSSMSLPSLMTLRMKKDFSLPPNYGCFNVVYCVCCSLLQNCMLVRIRCMLMHLLYTDTQTFFIIRM